MKGLDDIEDHIGYLLEQYSPQSVFFIGVIICITNKAHFHLNEYMDNLLGATITFSSIIVGFVGVLLAVLFSLKQSDTVKELFKYRIKERLKTYFERSIFSGVSVVGISTLLYLRNIFNFEVAFGITFSKILISLWIGLIGYLLTSTFILLRVIMHIIFSDGNSEVVKQLSEDEVKSLQEECSTKEEIQK